MSDNIRVVVKVRPLISREVEDKSSYRWRVKNNTLCQLDQNGRETDTCFTFDKVYDKDTKTEEVYKDVAKPIVEAAIAGFNGTIFAYGQTSSGKTYTMSGTEDSPGIIPLAVLNLFEMIREKKDRDFLVRVSYIEIYNETLKDLLDVEKKDFKIRDTLQGVKVDCTEKVTGSPEEVLEAMKMGEANRQTGATNMNEESSRSHSIFQITIESREHVEDSSSESGSVNVSQLNLVDLAGSERAGQTGATGLRFKEGTHINRSLSTLALVIKQLSEEQKYTNYRDSKLTRLLQHSLGGNALTCIVCAVTPASVEETISTLQFANRAKSIKNKPEVNAVATSATMIQSLTKQLSRLQSELAAKRNLEVMLESSKNVEQELQNKIAALQKLILNGFGGADGRSAAAGGRRRAGGGAARRVTISTLCHIDEEPPPREHNFRTPALKYNPLTTTPLCEPLPPPASRLPPVREEPAPLPTDVIEINSDDDSVTERPCSPYHGCFDTSKTPPCVLRKTAKLAEKNLQDIVELTEREKLYQPTVVELLEKLEQNSNVITQLQEEIVALKEQSQRKDCKIEELTTKVAKTEEEVESICSAKSQLEETYKANVVKLTDFEVSYETLAKKAKTRELELLSLLDQPHRKRESIGKPKKMETEMLNFMDMSKDISLVNSDNDSTQDDGSSQVQELVTNIQKELAAKNETITQLEADLFTQKQKIESLETTSEQLQTTINEFKYKITLTETENSLLKSTIENLNTTIDNQKQNLESANKDIESYNSTIQELQIKLLKKENILNTTIDDNVIDTMISNEQQVIANNDNIKNIIHSLKLALQNRNKEIDTLKSNEDTNGSNNTRLKEQLEIKEQQIETLIEEAEKLKQQLNENITVISKLMQVERELTSQLTTMQEENESLQKQNQDMQMENKTFVKQNKDTEMEIKKLQKQSENYTLEIESLQKKNSETEIQISNLQSDNEKLTRTVADIKANEQSISSKNQELLKQIEGMAQKISHLENDLNEKHKVIEELSHKLGEKEQYEQNLSRKNEEFLKQTEDMTEKICALEKLLDEIRRGNEELTCVTAEKEQKMSIENKELLNRINELEHDLNNKQISTTNAVQTILRKVHDIVLQVNNNTEDLPDSMEDLSKIIQTLDSKVDYIRDWTMQALQSISDLKDQLTKHIMEKDSAISLVKSEIEKMNNEMMIQNEIFSNKISQLNEEIKKSRADLEDKGQEIIKLEDKLSNAVLVDNDTKPKTEDHLNMACAVLHKLHSITSKLKHGIQDLPNAIDDFEKLFKTFDSELNVLNSSVTETLELAIDLQEKLMKVVDDKESEIADFQAQIETINSEMKIQTKKLSEQTLHLIEQLKITRTELDNKTQEMVELEIKLNDAKENNENLRNDLLSKDNSITLLHEKLASLYSELESLHNVKVNISTLENLLKEKYAQIKHLEEELASVVDTLEEKYQHVTNGLRDAIQNRDKLLVEILRKAARVARQCGIDDTDRCENADNVYEHVVITLDEIGMSIALLKAENDVKRSDIEQMLIDAKEKIENLTEINVNLKNDYDGLQSDNQELLQEIQRIKKISLIALDSNETLEKLNVELDSKSNVIKSMENNAAELKKQFKAYENTMNEQMNKLVAENEKFKTMQKRQSFLTDFAQNPNLRKSLNVSSLLENEGNPVKNSPQSLLTICCNKLTDFFQQRDEDQSARSCSSSKSSISFENVQTQTANCDCDELTLQLNSANKENLKLLEDLSKATAENLRLGNFLANLQASNDYLLEEREEVRKELQMLVEPASELQKKIANHRTNLSTLTATTYAENKLLHSQLKVLRHHHTRYTHVCQRDLPAFKNQLTELMTLLKENSILDKQNTSFKRYSLPDVLDNSSSTSAFKNNSTLDGDLLMLDTNVTMTTVDNTLVGHDQTCLDVTQTNFDANETACQTNDISKIIDPYIIYSQMETLSTENQKLTELVEKLEQENCNLKIEIQNSAKTRTAGKDPLCSPIKMNGVGDDNNSAHTENVCQYCIKAQENLRNLEENMNAELNIHLIELEKLKAEKDSIEEKFTNLTLEIPSTESLLQKLSNTEKDNAAKIQEINKLIDDVKKKNKIIKELQEENDTLSMQVMDNISEADDLKKELDELKRTTVDLLDKRTQLELLCQEYETKRCCKLCSQSFNKENIIESLQLEHSKLNRSLSDSDSSSKQNKFCTLQNELHASKEDCKTITEEVATIKNQLDRSNISVCQAMDLDESMGDSNVFAMNKDQDNAEESTLTKLSVESYTNDRLECFNFYVNKIGTGKETFDSNVKIIEIMTAFYNNIVAKHGNEVENLLNKLQDLEKSKNHLQTQLSDLTIEHSKVSKELQYNQNNIVTVTNTLSKIKAGINVINLEMSNVIDVDENTKAVTLFKENLLKVIDSEFGLSCVNIFENLVDRIINKHQKDLSGIMEQYTKLQNHMESVVTELNTVNENLKQMKCQLADKEKEYNLLKAQKERVHEISNAVTLDIVNKEKELKEMLSITYHRLVELEIISAYGIDTNLPFNESIKLLLEQIITKNKTMSQISKEKQNLSKEVDCLKTTLEQKEILLNTLQQQLSQCEVELQNQKSLNEDLSKKFKETAEENKTYLQTIENITSEITDLKKQIAQNENQNSMKVDDFKRTENKKSINQIDCEICNELTVKLKCWKEDYENLKITNDMIKKEKETYASELEKAREIIANNRIELDKMTSDILVLRVSVNDNVSIIEKMTQEAKFLMEQNVQLKKQFEDKKLECSRLEMNIKTHEKTAEIQSKIIIRLQKQKEEDDTESKNKDKLLDELTVKFSVLQEECEKLKNDLKVSKEEVASLKNKKDSLEAKVNQLEIDLTQDGHKRRSTDAIADMSRRRRQSLHDSKRVFAEDYDDKIEALFSARSKPDDLFMDVDEDSSNRSTPVRFSKGRDSLLARQDQDEHLTSRPSSVEQTRRRRQSIHDQHRMPRHTPSPYESLPTVESRSDFSAGDGGVDDTAKLRDQLTATQQELEELKERYRELDDECETCAQYLQERDEQCRKLRKEKIALERQVAELNEKIKFNPNRSDIKTSIAHAAVNTDEDWANLHSVVVDRMSFDAEVEKNKRLSRTIEELRCNKQELKNTIAKMQKALEKSSGRAQSAELQAAREEVGACRARVAELEARCRALDEECETCAQYLRERDHQCRLLREAKRALEKKLEELSGARVAGPEGEAGETGEAREGGGAGGAARRRRQSAHDMNRSPPAPHKHDCGDEFLSQPPERDDCALRNTNTQTQELQRVKMKLDAVLREKALLESQLVAVPTMYVATGSAIVQNQQISDVMKENQKLKKMNAKLINICKKRGKPHNRENEEPSEELG